MVAVAIATSSVVLRGRPSFGLSASVGVLLPITMCIVP